MLALGLAGLGAGRCNRRVDDLDVALCRNLLLRNDDLIADGAVLALGLARLGAGRCSRRVDHLSMPRCRDFLHAGEDRAAGSALRTGLVAGFLTGGGLLRHFFHGVSGRLDGFRSGFVADRTGVGLDACVFAGGCGRDHALIPLVAGRGNFALRSEHHAADGAADAVRQAGLGAGRRLARHDLLGVTLCGNDFLRNKNLAADGAVLALGLSGLGAGRLYRRIDDLGVALGRNHFALGDLLAADGADGVAGIAVLGAGGVRLIDHLGERMIVLPLGVERGVFRQLDGRFVGIGRARAVCRCVPALEFIALTGERILVQLRIDLFQHGLRLHRALDRVFLAAVGYEGDRQLSGFLAAPYAVDIVDNIASACGRSFRVGAVGVVQPGGCDGDGHRLIAICIILIGCGRLTGRALLNVLTGAVAGADIRTTLGGIDSTNSRYTAVHIHLGIDQIVVRTVICLARRICYRLKFAGAPDKVVGDPLIAVIEIDVLSVCDRQASALGNIDLNARQQSRILIDGHIAGLNIDGNVVGDRQYVACRVDTHACKL